MDRVIVACSECGQVYSARKQDDDRLILPVSDSLCSCGGECFDELGTGEDTSP